MHKNSAFIIYNCSFWLFIRLVYKFVFSNSMNKLIKIQSIRVSNKHSSQIKHSIYTDTHTNS